MLACTGRYVESATQRALGRRRVRGLLDSDTAMRHVNTFQFQFQFHKLIINNEQ